MLGNGWTVDGRSYLSGTSTSSAKDQVEQGIIEQAQASTGTMTTEYLNTIIHGDALDEIEKPP